MKPSFRIPRACREPREQGSVRSILLPLVCFVLGLAVSLVWIQRPARPPQSRQPKLELSDSTKELLNHVNQPVQIHFYSLLDPAAPAALGVFARRVDQLLSAYEQANDKIALTRFGTQTNADPNAALDDGIKGFAFDQGQGSYLGISFSSANKKEVLPQLSPEWESALEADVSRAIQRLIQTDSITKRTPSTTPSDTAILGEIRQRIANIDSVPLEEGVRILREASVKEFTTAVGEMQSRVQEAQARVVQAKNGSPGELDAAMKNLQAVQAEQARRLKEIAASSQARIDALKQLKSGTK